MKCWIFTSLPSLHWCKQWYGTIQVQLIIMLTSKVPKSSRFLLHSFKGILLPIVGWQSRPIVSFMEPDLNDAFFVTGHLSLVQRPIVGMALAVGGKE